MWAIRVDPVSYTHLDVYKRQLLRRRGELGKIEAASARGRIRVAADLDQLQRLGLRPGSFLVLGDRVITSWGGPDSLVQELTRATRIGLLAKLRSRTPR